MEYPSPHGRGRPSWSAFPIRFDGELPMIFRAMMAALLIVACAPDAAWASQSRGATTARNGTPAARKSASIAGRIIHADGTAAEGARIAIYAIREGAPAAVVGTATSSYDGRYEVTGLPAGQFAVGVTPQRTRAFGGDSRRLTTPAVETLYPGTTDRMQAQPVTVFDGVPTEGIDVWLEPVARRYSISGRVFWPDGTSIERFVIEYGGPEKVHHGVWYVTDPGGLFTVEGVSRGTYVLLARAETANGPLIGIASTDVSNDSVQDVRIALRQPGTIEGRLVIEGETGPDPATLRLTPVQSLLTLSPLYSVEEAIPDRSGRFTMSQLLGEFTIEVRGLPPGWRVRRVTRAGAALTNNHLTVTSGERVTGIEVMISSSAAP